MTNDLTSEHIDLMGTDTEKTYPDTIQGLCERIKDMIQDREALLMSQALPDPVVTREADQLKTILSQTRAYFFVPGWQDRIAD